MKYKLIGNNDYEHPMDTVLKNRDITMDLFSLSEDVVEDYNHYDNMQLGVETLLKHINNNDKIVTIPDSDVDGEVSSAILYRYIKEVFEYENISYVMHTKKVHGLSKDIKIEDDVKLIFCPDSSSNDYEQHKYFKDKGVDIIVLDHHPADYVSKDAIIINNRLSKNVINKQFAGVGVVFKFLKAIDNYLFIDKADNYIDLLTLGNVADMMSLKEKETRYYSYRGVKEINNPFLQALIEKNAFQLEDKYNIMKIGWVIAPKLNGTIRSATEEVKEDMFKAFISDDYEFALKVADECRRAKETQDRAVKSVLPKIEKNIKLTKDDKCLILEVSSALKQSHTGLVANKLQDKYGIPVILYRKAKNGIIGGNTRGNPNITENFKLDLTNSKLFDWCEGQNNAFGISFKEENLDKIKKYLNDLYKDKEIINGKTYQVDFILNETNFDYNIVYELAQYEDEWGNGVPEPILVFEDVTIDITDDNIKGKKVKNLVFEINGVKFIKKYLSNVIKESVLNKGELQVTIVGKAVNNFYNGNTYPQIEISELQIL